MRLGELIKENDYVSCFGGKGLNSIVKNISCDSRTAAPGDCFVCIKGFETDGHDYIPQAYKNGSRVFVVEDLSWTSKIATEYPDAAVLLVDDTRSMLSTLSDRFFGSPSKKITVVGVTGTNGKTSVTNYIFNALRKLGLSTGMIGTIEIRMNDEIWPSSRTTPESLELHKIFKTMLDKGIDYVVMEVSSHALTLLRVQDIEFDISVFTNLTQDHLDFHKTMGNYADAKYMLMKKSNKASIVNIDDNYGNEYMNALKKEGKRVLTYGMQNKADIISERNEAHGITTIKSSCGEIEIESSSRFETYNKMAAYAVLKELGFDIDELQSVLWDLKGAKGRFQKVPGSEKLGIEIIVDYAHTPDALSNVIEAINEYKKGRLIAVFGCGGERDPFKRPMMGKIASSGADLVILTDDNPRREDANNIIMQIENGMKKGRHEVIRDRKEAIRKAIILAEAGDVVLIAGKGHEKLQIIGDESFEHDDFQVARSVLEAII
ncbi:MAG: UDP-N-acetylmuramoyl-L-alanyl-D-glutamate--2,6-diaminopimelate ligase [Clostridiales bacterium]|nr:MAG: UDP-N-acetylmuramoyl-L-alanyl-D-glutamate--2,6-diaminopimelate ligase [Clostridiales bacterium]